jgi:hypothetical protein
MEGVFMRLEILMATALAVLSPGSVMAALPEKATGELASRVIHPGLPLPESDKGVYGVRLTVAVDQKGEGRGTLVLEPNAPTYDEFGFVTTAGALPPVKLECTLKLVRKARFDLGSVRPRPPEEWLLFRIQGPKITSRLSLATPVEDKLTSGRLLVHDKDGKVQYAVDVWRPGPPEPCHPGCFPAGTSIGVPGGTKPIERIRQGDLITTVGPDGDGSQAKVVSVFVTRNRLVEVRTEVGNLVTTQTQPLALAGGGLRAAGELKAGDRIGRWENGRRRTAKVQSVSPTGREETVFNLILREPAVFVADGFLARSKPPAPAGLARTSEETACAGAQPVDPADVH